MFFVFLFSQNVIIFHIWMASVSVLKSNVTTLSWLFLVKKVKQKNPWWIRRDSKHYILFSDPGSVCPLWMMTAFQNFLLIPQEAPCPVDSWWVVLDIESRGGTHIVYVYHMNSISYHMTYRCPASFVLCWNYICCMISFFAK